MEPLQILTIVTIVMFVVLAIISIAIAINKRRAFAKLTMLVEERKFDEFFRLIDAPFTRLTFPDYNRTYFKLNAYMVKGDDKAALEVLDDLLSRKTSAEQRADLIIKAFNVYISLNKGKKAKAMLKEIEQLDPSKYKSAQDDCRMMYDIAVLKKYNYIELMESALEKKSGPARGQLEYLLALQYQNKGNMEKRDEYLKRSVSRINEG
ncbi:tetratricopeptide repeat protein [Collinsella tanakaei]|uniref:tetratricopeptide repeat protein n=1 Tax=Collinsella tanakaei TaxID=626935 RepID=UPI0025A391E0|nr:hypothetical protein [Collinsella tanakaei]MDM8300386.1 hypothetical protein [Collinsella tanakaei]